VHGEEEFSEMWRSFEVAEKVDEKVVWIGGACVFVLGRVWLVGMRMVAFMVSFRAMAI
jgi:hypothetical protein